MLLFSATQAHVSNRGRGLSFESSDGVVPLGLLMLAEDDPYFGKHEQAQWDDPLTGLK